MPAARNVLFITLDQWRGDCLSALGHPVLETPTLDALAARACSSPTTGPTRPRAARRGRASTPAPTNTTTARSQRHAARRPLHQRRADSPGPWATTRSLFGYTDTSVDPRTVPPGDPRLYSYEGVLPGFRALVEDPWEQGSPAWGRWLADARRRRPGQPARPLPSRWRASPAPTTTGRRGRRPASRPSCRRRRSSATAVIEWLEQHGDEPFFVHASFIRPAPAPAQPGRLSRPVPRRRRRALRRPRRRAEEEAAIHPLGAGGHAASRSSARRTTSASAGSCGPRTTAPQREVDDGWPPLFALPRDAAAWPSRHAGRRDQRPRRDGRRPLAAREARLLGRELPRPADRGGPAARGRPGRGRVFDAVTESVDVLPTICEYIGAEVPLQADGWSLAPFLAGRRGARALARHGPLRMGLLGPGPGGSPSGRSACP